MDWLLLFGSLAVGAMLLTYWLEEQGSVFILGFALAGAASPVYGWLAGTYPFGVIEAVWALIALRRWRRRIRREAALGLARWIMDKNDLIIAGKRFHSRLSRELTGSSWLKLEVIPDPRYLLPDPIGTLQAAETLVKEGFTVLPYIHADPILAKRLEEAGCATVMPLGSPIGSGRGIFTLEEIQIIIENAGVPVVVDAGLGSPSEAALALELGADAVLVNTAIARAKDPVRMAGAVRPGRGGGGRGGRRGPR